MQILDDIKAEWVYPLKKKILLGLSGILILSILTTTAFIVIVIRNSLIKDSTIKTLELSNTIESSLRILMLKRDPDMIQDTIENLGKNKDSIVKAFILDMAGRVVYSTDKNEIGKILNKYTEISCHGCHQRIDTAPPESTIIIENNDIKVQRDVKVIYNEAACYGCHSKANRINGKLIIDRSLKQTYSLIHSIELIIFGSGIVCLVFLIPLLSKRIDKYIFEIVRQSTEITLLYKILERLSKTIDLEELTSIVINIIKETVGASEVDMILLTNNKTYKVFTQLAGKDKILRKKIDKNDPLLLIINNWLNGELEEVDISEDGKQVCMPITKGDTRLALIIVKRVDGTFDPQRLRFTGAICYHIAIAFENARLYHIAITDELTHLYTSRYFRSCIDREISHFEKYGEKITLLLLDLDDFKKINDVYGHLAGDSVLKGIAQCIWDSIGDDDLAFRYGGEEFAVLLPSTDARGGRQVAERIRKSVEDSVFKEGSHDLKITISIGVSTCPDNANTPRDLILTADRALYKAKETGKNKVVISVEEGKAK